MMRKRMATAAQIRFEIQRRIRESVGADRACRDCHAPEPVRTEPDGTANWTVASLQHLDPARRAFVEAIVATMRRDYDMIDR